MKEVFWYDINKEQPKEGQAIFYLDIKSSLWYDSNKRYSVCSDDIDKGEYVTANLVEWSYDMPPEEFKYWYPIPKEIKF